MMILVETHEDFESKNADFGSKIDLRDSSQNVFGGTFGVVWRCIAVLWVISGHALSNFSIFTGVWGGKMQREPVPPY